MLFDIALPPSPDKPLAPELQSKLAPINHWTPRYIFFKRVCDISFSLLALPIILCTSIVLLILNPIFNPGPLIFSQTRMGMGGKPIRLWKFRTMTISSVKLRAPDTPVEHARIPRLGKRLRQTRIDELPNFFNVLIGEMSLVGPRPEAWDHAIEFLGSVPYYRDRFRVLPGITGLAQVRGGYADNPRATKRKARIDHFYVARSCTKMDIYIMYKTCAVLVTGFGAK